MTDKFLELELRMVMEGLEELLTLSSYQSQLEHCRILSVETVEEAEQRELAERSQNVISLESRRHPRAGTFISKALYFRDQQSIS
ncbi:MAG: hypothetical protein Kow0083_11420 [Methylophaga sp.]|jgi:anion-transporting  ArsA/GET3 family ATPase